MLDALPVRESLFYSDEANVIDYNGKSRVIFVELTDQFSFVGGDL